MLRKTPPFKEWQAKRRTDNRNDTRTEKSEDRQNGKVWRTEKERKSLTNLKGEFKKERKESAAGEKIIPAKHPNRKSFETLVRTYVEFMVTF